MFRVLSALFLWLFMAVEASAVVSTTVTPLSTTAWTDLGAGPLMLSFNGLAVYRIADSLPTSVGPGFTIPTDQSRDIQTSSHVYALATGPGGASAIVAPINAAGSGSYDLVRNVGARCDGVTDDTVAIQAWLSTATANSSLTAPAGTCLFSSPLTLPAAGRYTMKGAGQYATVFKYQGASATANLLTVNSPNAASQIGVMLRDFQLSSSTTMTGGYAIVANGLFESQIDNVALDSVNGGNGKLCGGLWANGAGGLWVNHPDFRSGNVACGDGVTVNSNLGGSAGFFLTGGGIIRGFANALHEAGGFGGLTCDGRTDISINGSGLLIDDAKTATGNRETKITNCPIDTNNNDGVVINDPLAAGGLVVLGDTVWSSQAGNGVKIVSWPNGTVQISGSVYNNCGDGVYVQDQTISLIVSPGAYVGKNGFSSLSSACATWLVGAGAGHGYGLNAFASFGGIWSLGRVYNNQLGNFAPNARLNSNVFDQASLTIPVNISGSNIPLIYPSSGTMGNNGALTMTTALDATYASAYVYMPANAISAGSAAGWYYAQCASATACTLFNNSYSTGKPAAPASPVAFSTTGPGAYTQTTGSAIQAFAVTVSANMLGPNDGIVIDFDATYNNSSNNKVIGGNYGSLSFGTGTLTTTHHYSARIGFRNRNSTSLQALTNIPGGGFGAVAGNQSFGSVDTTVGQTLNLTVNQAAATDYTIFQNVMVTKMPGV